MRAESHFARIQSLDWPLPNNPDAGLETRRKSTSLSISKWLSRPQKLQRCSVKETIGHAFNLILVLLPVSFIVIGALAASLNGKIALRNHQLKWARNLLWFTSTLGVTIYPILFATVMSRALKQIALWTAERGEKLGRIEQLMGSGTVFGSLSTQIALRGYNVLGLTLVAVWLLSPLGGQASLRLIEITNAVYYEKSRISYMNTERRSLMSTNASTADVDAINALYKTSLSDSGKSDVTEAMWTNVRIPIIESLASYDAAEDGWISVPSGRHPSSFREESSPNILYSSALGIPVSKSEGDDHRNGSFVMDSSYYLLNCSELFNTPIQISSPQNRPFFGEWDWFRAAQGDATIALGIQSEAKSIQQEVLNNIPRRILFESRAGSSDNYSVADCTASTSFVQSLVVCNQTYDIREMIDTEACVVTRIRRAQLPREPALTPLRDYSTCANFLQQFASASISIGAVPLFNADYTIFDWGQSQAGQNYWKIDAIGRLHSLFNTYWLATLGLAQVSKDLSLSNLRPVPQGAYGTYYNLLGSAATFHEERSTGELFICHRVWLAILLVSAGVLFIVGAIGWMMKCHTLAPDILGSISSHTRDNSHMRIPSGGSALGGMERTRLLFDMRVRLQDVKPEEAVGHIALTAYEETWRSNLDRRKLYL
ncbi:MAG: hypothetical protein M1816_006816 [Peltula sp. TS41687]|nr:MAG: hypothetical protein M1816_006816 [Peltula sp. TS41687]